MGFTKKQIIYPFAKSNTMMEERNLKKMPEVTLLEMSWD
jgi:hypothetical protein